MAQRHLTSYELKYTELKKLWTDPHIFGILHFVTILLLLILVCLYNDMRYFITTGAIFQIIVINLFLSFMSAQ